MNFLCQSSSIHFLSSVGFDFNKLFREGASVSINIHVRSSLNSVSRYYFFLQFLGIPYLNIIDEEALNEELVSKYENLSQSENSFSKVSIPDELLSTVEDAWCVHPKRQIQLY